MQERLLDFVRGLGLDAYLVGGAVRDELLGIESKDADFLVPRVDHAGLRAALEPHGRVEDLEVAGQLVGARLYPRDTEVRALAPKGIEFAPPRAERSTGPGHHDFVIVADPGISLDEDMARRDFTVNAMARRLATGELVDPLGGAEDLRGGILRTVSPRSFAEDPLRLVRGLRLVAALDLEPEEGTLAQMREEASSIRLVSGERLGGGLAADGLGELSKLLLAPQPAKGLRLARDTGVLVELLPELAASIGFDQQTRHHELPLDEHTFNVVQATADAGRTLPVRLAALFHDAGKPASAWRGEDGDLHFYGRRGTSEPGHAELGAELAGRALGRLRYPNDLRRHVVRLVRHHMFGVGKGDPVRARRFLAEHGHDLARDLVDLREADLVGKGRPSGAVDEELEALRAFRARLEGERDRPLELGQLEVDGSDLIGLGFEPGPELGRTLDVLLRDVVGDPSLNRRDWLLRRARQLMREAAG
jgi:tRNA nucleotidyltransferase/poly(A) polymerase